MGSVNVVEDGDLQHLRIRLTEHSKRVNLSGCPQMTSEIILLSILPSNMRGIVGQSLLELATLNRKCQISSYVLPAFSFEAVEEVDISKCPRLSIRAAIECFCKSFPSLKKLKAAYLLVFKTTMLYQLVQKCPLVCEVDLTVDISPIIPAQVSVISSSLASKPQESNKFLKFGGNSVDGASLYHQRLLPSNLTKLTLEGRCDISDSDLGYMSSIFTSLSYLNIRGCVSVTDVGISVLLQRCSKLNSLLVCDTSFGMNSVQALCFNDSAAKHFGNRSYGSLASKLQTLHMGGCKGVDETSLLALISETQMLQNLCLRECHLNDLALYSFSGSSLETLDVSNTMVTGGALAHVVRANSGLKSLKARGCTNFCRRECDNKEGECSSSSSLSKNLCLKLSNSSILEEIALGWGLSSFSLETLKPAITSLRTITVGLGGSLSEDALEILPSICPLLESIILYFQVISTSIMFSILASLRHLQVLALCYCLGDISVSTFSLSMPNLKKLRLERVTPWMTNNDLVKLTQNCANLIELSLIGCTLLNRDTPEIISNGWPGLICIHLEDCGEVTALGVSSLFNCKALEYILLRHNGPGIPKNFILDAASKMPMLRQISLDMCDASEGKFDIPCYKERHFLSNVKIARCSARRCNFLSKTVKRPVHKETLVLIWSSKDLSRVVVKERL